jgi:hypothetical protein
MNCIGIAKGEHTEAFLLDKLCRTKHKQEYQCRIPVKRHRTEKKSQKWREIVKKQGKEEKVGITYKTVVPNNVDEDDSDERPSKQIVLNTEVCKKPCVRCGHWDHTRMCKWCPESEDYPPDRDSLYNEWEKDMRSKGVIPDITGQGESQQDSNASEQNLGQDA